MRTNRKEKKKTKVETGKELQLCNRTVANIRQRGGNKHDGNSPAFGQQITLGDEVVTKSFAERSISTIMINSNNSRYLYSDLSMKSRKEKLTAGVIVETKEKIFLPYPAESIFRIVI